MEKLLKIDTSKDTGDGMKEANKSLLDATDEIVKARTKIAFLLNAISGGEHVDRDYFFTIDNPDGQEGLCFILMEIHEHLCQAIKPHWLEGDSKPEETVTL